MPDSFNTILIASAQPTSVTNLAANLAALPADASPALRLILTRSVSAIVPTRNNGGIFTDDRAPVEALVDSIVLRFLLSDELDDFRQ